MSSSPWLVKGMTRSEVGVPIEKRILCVNAVPTRGAAVKLIDDLAE